MRIARWLIAVFLMFATAQAAAQNLLFRGDGRDPAIIFRDGFAGAGTNRNLLAHISGESCWLGEGPRRSAFVATTSVMEHAMRYGSNPSAQRGWIYRIVPDANAPETQAFFDAHAGLNELAQRTFLDVDLQVQSAIWRLSHFHATRYQYVSERIPAERIHSVDVYERNPVTGMMEFARNERNPNFVQPARVGGRATFTASMIAALAPIDTIAVVGSGSNATTACVSNGCAVSRAVPSLIAPQSLEQCSFEEVLEPGNLFQQVVDIILD